MAAANDRMAAVDESGSESDQSLTFDIEFRLEDLEKFVGDTDKIQDWDEVPDKELLAALLSMETEIEATIADPDQCPDPAVQSVELSRTAVASVKSEFATLSESDLLQIESAKDEKSTKSSTNWGCSPFQR